MVEIFKTDVESLKQARALIRSLKSCYPKLYISFDLEDRDRILRIKGEKLSPADIIKHVQQQGRVCSVIV